MSERWRNKLKFDLIHSLSQSSDTCVKRNRKILFNNRLFPNQIKVTQYSIDFVDLILVTATKGKNKSIYLVFLFFHDSSVEKKKWSKNKKRKKQKKMHNINVSSCNGCSKVEKSTRNKMKPNHECSSFV